MLEQNQKKYVAYTAWWKIPLKWSNGKIIKIWGKDLNISKLDFKDLQDFSDEEILEIIKKDLFIDLIKDPENWLKKINQFFKIAIREYNDSVIKRIFERKKVNHKKQTTFFNSVEEVIVFMKEAWLEEWWWEAKYKCIMLKITSSIADIINHNYTKDLDKKKEEIISKLRLVLSLREVWEELIGFIWWKKFILYWRDKKDSSKLDKIISQINYSRAEDILDDKWLTLELIKWWTLEFLQLFEIIQNVVISLWWKIKKTKAKWIDIKKFKTKNNIPQNIIKIIDDISFESKKWTSSWYIDLKVICEINWVLVEIKLIPHGNKNQDWINFQWIYAYLQKYIEWYVIRHLEDWYITDEEIEIICEAFFDNLQELINENPEKTWTSKEELLQELWNDFQKMKNNKWVYLIRPWIKFENRPTIRNIQTYLLPWLIRYYKDKLIKISLKNQKETYTNERWKKLLENWFYKKN